jgi:hypothetical protein
MVTLRRQADAKQISEARTQLFQEFRAGIWDRDEYKAKVSKLEKRGRIFESDNDLDSSPPRKKQKHKHQRPSTPTDWSDSDNDGSVSSH